MRMISIFDFLAWWQVSSKLQSIIWVIMILHWLERKPVLVRSAYTHFMSIENLWTEWSHEILYQNNLQKEFMVRNSVAFSGFIFLLHGKKSYVHTIGRPFNIGRFLAENLYQFSTNRVNNQCYWQAFTALVF